ncbi:Ig-like domain-containing protein [Ruminiclostridium cellobioparum]|uniref:Ig-like domain-containing protein n=1 Tax=Ruminiclostridium cellobioparum TaxID=29355 RepID=UPI0028B0E7AA|nr:Ig-like domain-containing protein [Ruminiclostridium cellobioparum]
MKRFSKLLCFVLVFVSVIAVFCAVSFAAAIGQPLTNPESGWQRIDDNDPRFFYSGTSALETGTKAGGSYNSTLHRFANGGSGFVKFKFYGTKFRVISNFSPTAGYSADIRVIIDGITESSISSRGSSFVWQVLMYEKTGMELGFHEIILIPQDSTTYGGILDAIDIDDTGYLVDYNTPTNLIATPGNATVDLTWDTVEGLTSYNVKRSLTPGGPYRTITTTSAITYTDTDVTNGTIYYYVVTADVSGIESDPSNEASATPQATNQLKLVLEVNQEKQLSVSEELSDNTEMDWISSDVSIATVNANGKIKALKPGNTVITCTSKDKSYTELINVVVEDLEYQLAVDLNIGGTCRLTIDNLTNTTYVTWSSYDPTIATVSAKGKVTAVSEGLTYVVASDKDDKEIGRIYIRVRQ